MGSCCGMKRVCVFCGSNPGARPSYLAAARELGALLARRGVGLVYGGASVGLMGAVADAALAAGGEVIGVIPQSLVDREVAHAGLPQLRVVRSMHERKAMMADLADGFVALPGGFGTLEELCEIFTWLLLGHHEKPVGLLDVEGFYGGFLAFCDHATRERFVRPEQRGMLLSASDPADLLDRMAAFRPIVVRKWISGDET